ncbi:MAG TPA: hypothetical protein ENJ89_10510, partial [Caldithrix abyssi]|nr:hypothetical protein [Caldithrix abyssi]
MLKNLRDKRIGKIAVAPQTEKLIHQFASYRLKPFRFILDEILGRFGSLDGLRGKRILELGPGGKLQLLTFLIKESPAQVVRGVGRHAGISGSAVREMYVDNAELLTFLKKLPARSFDLIYSRHVMEAHSINPLVLLGSKAYWRAVRQGTISHPDETFPASVPNLQAIFKQALRVLTPGGVIISQIAKKKYSALTPEFLSTLKIQDAHRKTIGRLS